jgi:hypothetical protein
MGFERSPFGDGSASGSGNVTTAVNNHYGTRTSDRAQGKVKTEGTSNEVSIEITGVDAGNESFPLLSPWLPDGAIIEKVFLEVKEAFDLGGTTPTILFGTEGSEVTNGFVVSETQAETPGTYDVTSTLTGTWAAPLDANTTVGLALGGGTPTATEDGKLEVVIRYTVI